MPAPDVLKAKVCLVGEAAVGKSSLVRRLVDDQYDDRYFPALGAKVSKTEIPVRVAGRDVTVVLTVWDIMGERTFRELMADAWLSRVQGVLAVADVTRPSTFETLPAWVATARSVSRSVPIILLANKVDLAAGRADETLLTSAADLGLPWWATSAKTGRGVHGAFRSLAEAIALANLPPTPTALVPIAVTA